MKTRLIIGLVMVALSMGMIYTTMAGTSRYASFSTAWSEPDKKFTIIGKINRDKEIVSLPNRFEFYLIDDSQTERRVVANESKPQDFERSEQVVVTGKADGDDFIASRILLKCPSKYNNTNK
ncbi:MAG: cytochrome c maturation protein CcmE [Flavobacteriales bacterium]